MKLILENWRKYLNEAQADIDARRRASEEYMDFMTMHNLFVDYIKNELVDDENPEVIKYLKSYRGGSGPGYRRANKLMQNKYKWGFPHDIDPNMNCEAKLRYLDKLVGRFWVDPEPYNTVEKPGGEPLRETTDGESPYQQCRSDAAEEKALRDATSQEMQEFPGRAWYRELEGDLALTNVERETKLTQK